MYGYVFLFTFCCSAFSSNPVQPVDTASEYKNGSDNENIDVLCTNDPDAQRDRSLRVLHYIYAYPYVIASPRLSRRRQLFKVDGDS